MNKKPSKRSPEVRERAVRLVREQRSEHPSMWAAVESIAPMIGYTPQTLPGWIKRDKVARGERDGVSTAKRERIKALERDVKSRAGPTRFSAGERVFRPGRVRPTFHVCDSQTSFHFLEGRFFGASEPVAPIGDTGSDARR